jgi:hypothetical protein
MRSSEEVAQHLLLGWKFNGRIIELSIRSREVDITVSGKITGVSDSDVVFAITGSGEVRFSLDGFSSEAVIPSNGLVPVSLVFKKGEDVIFALLESDIVDYS